MNVPDVTDLIRMQRILTSSRVAYASKEHYQDMPADTARVLHSLIVQAGEGKVEIKFNASGQLVGFHIQAGDVV